MIPVKRLPEPDILRDKKEQWLAKFQEKRQSKPNARPSSSQYGHAKIRDILHAMSSNKCFYCEGKLSESDAEIDHYREVAEYPELAFEWNNLYLSCSECNKRKEKNININVENCLDPCDEVECPADHMTFDGHTIRSRKCSVYGLSTIKKYKLNRDELKFRREVQLRYFVEFLLKIQTARIYNNGSLDQTIREKILSFKQPDHPFSLMFSNYIEKTEL